MMGETDARVSSRVTDGKMTFRLWRAGLRKDSRALSTPLRAVDLRGVAVGPFGNRDGDKRTKKARACFHEHSGEAHSKLGETIAVTFLDSRYETMSRSLLKS